MAVKIPDPLERFRPAGLHGFIFRYQKSPLLKVIPFNCPVVAIVAHRILLSGDLISEFVNLHNCEPPGRANARPMTGSAKQSMAPRKERVDCSSLAFLAMTALNQND